MSVTNYEITGLTPYTNYTIHVRAIGESDLRGDVDVEILQRTNSTIEDTGKVISVVNTRNNLVINTHL